MAQMMIDVRTAAAEPADLLAAVGGFAEWSASSDTSGHGLFDARYLELYLDNLEQVSDLAGELGYAGLQGTCLMLQENVEALRGRDGAHDAGVRDALETWVFLVQSYLELPPGSGADAALAHHLELPLWDAPLDPADAEVLHTLLMEDRQQAVIGEEAAAIDGAADEAGAGLAGDPVGEETQEAATAVEERAEDLGNPASAQIAAGDDALLEPTEGQAVEESGAGEAAAVEDLFGDPGPAPCAETPAADEEVLGLTEDQGPEETKAADATSIEDRFDDPGAPLAKELAEELAEGLAVADEAELGFGEDQACEEVTAAEAAPVEDLLGDAGDPPAAESSVADEYLLGLAEALFGDARHQQPAEMIAADQDGWGVVDSGALAVGQSDEPLDEDLPPEVLELVAVLLEELPVMEEPLQHLLQGEVFARSEPEDFPEGAPAGRAEACDVYADYLDRFADAAEAVGFSGLQQVVASMRENLALLAAQPRPFTPGEIVLLADWSDHASLYLRTPNDAAASLGLIEWLQAPEWPQPLAAEQAQDLLVLLQAPSLPDAELEDEVEARPAQAGPKDVSLALPEDVNVEVVEALLQELPGQTQTFTEAIQNLIAGGSLDDVNVAQRIAHTLKGAGNTVGVTGLATLTHHLEDILEALAKHKALPAPALALSLMNAADCLEAMGEALCGIADPPDNAQAVLQEVLDWANRIDREGLPEADATPTPALATTSAAEPQPGAPRTEVTPQDGSQKGQSQAQSPAARKQVATELVDDLLRMGGETIILSGQVHEQVRRIDERMRAMQAEFERLQQLGGELERLIDIRDLSTDRRQQRDNSDFDALEMDQYSELHTTSRMLVEAATDARQLGGMVTDQLQRLDKVLITQERLHRETQETVLSARMVPIRTHVSRLERSVRQTCRLTGKQAQLHVSGANTLMDGEVLNALIDPLMHLLRNAVDHGIESPAQRSAAGKPDLGNLWLDFVREGNNILVRCRDDGAGFDFAAIRRAAESRGLLEPGQSVSEEDLKTLVLMPNFSTRSEVTQTSGRGVGLDVVNSHVVSHGGSMTLKSETSKGSTTELRLPVSLVSTHALLVRMRGQVIAVADRGIEQILHAEDGKERMLGDQMTFQVGQRIYPLKPLDEILGLAPDHRSSQRAPTPVLLVRDRTGITAVRVQEVTAGTDLVVKEFGRYVPRLPGILGATILGDGAVTPVLDLPELMSGIRKPVRQAASAGAAAEVEREAQRQPVALVVDDSLSARRALAQVMQDAGYEVRAARDGLEAVEIAKGKRPDIVLADMEMPRMNGIELTSHLRARAETADVPVIMITSRSTAKHRQQAEAAGVNVYLIKPFLDDELLDHVAALRGQR